MQNKLTNRKENLIPIVITLLFVFGFLILINYNTSIIGYETLEINNTLENIILNETIEQNITLNESLVQLGNIILNESIIENSEQKNLSEFEIQGAGDQIVNNQFPLNDTTTYARYINFTFNVTDPDNYIDSCILYLDIDEAGYDANITVFEANNNTYTNKSDGFSASFAGASPAPWDITTNGTDFWIVDTNDDWIYHVNKSGYNFTGTLSETGFSASFAGPLFPSPLGITTNGTDFWIIDGTDGWIYHVNKSGYNFTGILSETGFSASYAGAFPAPYGITTNNTDFWITDTNDDWIYHVNKSGYNFTGILSETGFSTSFAGASPKPYSITTNGSDFWIADFNDVWIFHINKSGYNFTGTLSETGFSASFSGASPNLIGITTPSLIDGGAPTEFWTTDWLDEWVYHLKKQVIETVNNTVNKTFDSDGHLINWKVGCTADDSTQVNSTIYNLSILNILPIINLQFPANNTQTSTRQINFTFNVSDINSYIDSCILYLDIDGAGYDANKTIFEANNNTYTNKSDGFSAYSLTSSPDFRSMTTNGTDFWILEYQDEWIYHLNKSGYNFTGTLSEKGFSSSSDSLGITTNGTDFWMTDFIDYWIYHVNKSGYNFTGTLSESGFSTSFAGAAPFPFGITTNGTDFWIVDFTDDWIYHVNKSGYNFTGILSESGFSAASFAGAPSSNRGITTNGSDFWIADSTDAWIYHINKSGYNFTGTLSESGFSASFAGVSPTPYGITTTALGSLSSGGGTPTEFWITDMTYDWIFHLKKQVIETVNNTVNKTFDSDGYLINWKVGCTADDLTQVNSTIYNLSILNILPTINLQAPENNTETYARYINFTYNITDYNNGIDNCTLFLNISGAGYNNKTTNKSITEDINQTFNKSFISEAHTLYWKIGCYDDSDQVNSTAHYLSLLKEAEAEEQGIVSQPTPPPPAPEPTPEPTPEPEPPAPPTPPSEPEEVGQEIGIPEMNLDPGFSGVLKKVLSEIKVSGEPRIPVFTITNKTLLINLNQTKISIDFEAEKTAILIQETISVGEKPKKTKIFFKKLFVILLILIVLYYILYYVIKKYSWLKKHHLTIDRFLEKINSETIRSIKSIIKRKQKFKPIIIELTEDVKKQINRHKSLLRSIKINISKNNLDLANKQYEEMISIYKSLIIKLNGEDQSKIHNIMRNIYYELKIANEIYYYKKKLK